MDRTWMYTARRTDAYFREQLNKFIQAAETHARIEKAHLIHCPCKPYKNTRVFSDTTIIRSHVLISGSIDNYMIWNKHSEEAPPRENQLEEILQAPAPKNRFCSSVAKEIQQRVRV